ncbi:HNH endonuclease signature motif containing protein [Dielma fastidiosa]|uniref:HNH endonuclease signature motif containing protein n=1 Tax=Dielma fastidiosa TaxID=1034346 RepID=UPI0023F44AAE|nr:HNH endonuclease signature motif containing protein [Dielma fastidiosa]
MRYTEEMKEFILENYKGISSQELTERFNRRFGTSIAVSVMKSYKSNHKLNSGLTGCFPKGHVPVNKGTKGMFNAGGNKTSFKTGQLPPNTDPIGTEKVLKDGYVWVKINDAPKAKKNVNWKQKQKLIWEQVNGPVPHGYFVMFADGNNRNFHLDNLVLVTKAEMLYLNRNGLIYNDSEVTKSGVLIARMISKANDLKRRKKK